FGHANGQQSGHVQPAAIILCEAWKRLPQNERDTEAGSAGRHADECANAANEDRIAVRTLVAARQDPGSDRVAYELDRAEARVAEQRMLDTCRHRAAPLDRKVCAIEWRGHGAESTPRRRVGAGARAPHLLPNGYNHVDRSGSGSIAAAGS